jgi:hypothetical protein
MVTLFRPKNPPPLTRAPFPKKNKNKNQPVLFGQQINLNTALRETKILKILCNHACSPLGSFSNKKILLMLRSFQIINYSRFCKSNFIENTFIRYTINIV